jgi:hypothetical protein
MSVAVCEQLGPVMGTKQQAVPTQKIKYQRQGLFLYEYAKYAEYVLSRKDNMQNM